jgi:biopolymer transport protein ExbD
VLASVETDESRSKVVITIDKNSNLAIAKRPVGIEALKDIPSVAGLTEHPPAVLIRAHKMTPHDTIRTVLDCLTESGMWLISFEAVEGKQV